jgi:ferritin
MIDKAVEEALNRHLNHEFYSSYLYLSMSAWFQRTGLRGHAHWMRIQSREEQGHVTRMYNYLLDRDGRVALGAIEAPPTEWETPLAAFEAAYEHEQGVTQRINELVDLALTQRDHATHNFLQWFVREQVEEEAVGSDIVGRSKVVEGGRGLILIDQELAARPATRNFEPPPPVLGEA